jgi:hypothetical protein
VTKHVVDACRGDEALDTTLEIVGARVVDSFFEARIELPELRSEQRAKHLAERIGLPLGAAFIEPLFCERGQSVLLSVQGFEKYDTPGCSAASRSVPSGCLQP